MTFRSFSSLAILQAAASADLYIKGCKAPFHHTLIEFLAAGRPVIYHPAETPEAVRIAGEARMLFYSCAEGRRCWRPSTQCERRRSRRFP